MNKIVRTQQGSSLIIGMIMLFMTTVALTAAYNMSSVNLSVVQNMQDQNLAIDLANSTLEAAVSTDRLVNTPDAVLLGSCGLNRQCFDVNNDGTQDVTVELTPAPSCLQSRTLQNAALDVSDPEDAGCLVAGIGSFGVEGAEIQNSLCAGSVWQVTAVATDEVTQSRQTVSSLYSIRVSTDSVDSFCP